MLEIAYKNCLDASIGSNGLKARSLAAESSKIPAARKSLDSRRKSGKLGFFDLPYDVQSADRIARTADGWRGKFENFVVIGIGGSALGNIALQTALRHPQWNLLSSAERKGRLKLFVPDNVDPGFVKGVL